MIIWTKLSESDFVPTDVYMLIAFDVGFTTAYLNSERDRWIGDHTFLPFNRVTHFCLINMPNEDEHDR